MSYGLQLSASGVMSALYRQDVFANNLANMDTVGFKPDVPNMRARQPARQEDHLDWLPSNDLLERLGGGVAFGPNRTSFAQGGIKPTGNPLDCALVGEGFFVMRDEADKSGEALRFSRDGRFTRNANGQMVSASSGLPLLDAGGTPISLPDGPVQIGADGTIRQGPREIARIGIMDFNHRQELRKLGHGVLAGTATTLGDSKPATPIVRQHAVEDSAVNEFKAMMDVTGAGRDVDANVALMQQHDRMLDRAINTLARVG